VSEHKAKKGGVVTFERVTVVTNDAGQRIALARTGEIVLTKGTSVERFAVPNGAEVFVTEGQEVGQAAPLVKWDPHSIPIISEEGGTVRYKDIKEGETLRKDRDASTGIERLTIMEHRGDLHPVIEIVAERGQVVKSYFI